MTQTDAPAPSGSIMLFIAGSGYVNARSASRLGLRGEPAYEVAEPEAGPATKKRKKPASKPDNDNPVFEVAEAERALPSVVDEQDEWTPPSGSSPRGRMCFRYGTDGPAVSWRVDAQAARLTSNRYSGQVANDNQDWPLGKLFRAEGSDHFLALAERYRDMWNAANMPHDMIGRDIGDDLYVLGDRRLDESTGAFIDKGAKALTGKRAQVDVAPTRASKADPDKTKKRAKPIPRKWNGDWPLLNHIDAGRELSAVQGALGPIREAFEAAVVLGETLEAIGHNHGVGNKTGAKGAGRALVMTGLQCVDEFWQKRGQNYAEPECRPIWEPGNPVPIGYYRTVPCSPTRSAANMSPRRNIRPTSSRR